MRTRPAADLGSDGGDRTTGADAPDAGCPALGAHEAECDSVARARLDDDRRARGSEASPSCTGVLLNVAVADCAVVSFTAQVVFFPVHAPLQPRNDCPAAALAVSAADAPALKCWTHVFVPPVLEQAPAEVDTEPRPSTRTVSVPGVPAAANVADTLFAAVMLTVQVAAVPVHDAAPARGRIAPEAGDWLRTAVVPGVKVAVHVVAPLPQLIPLPVTRPGPAAETVSANVLVPARERRGDGLRQR